MAPILGATLPVFFIALLGVLAERVLRPDVSGFIRLVLYLFVPFLVFEQVAGAGTFEASLFRFVAAFALTYLLLYLLSTGLGRALKLTPAARKTLIAAALFPNSGNMGLSVALFGLGEEGLRVAVFYFLLATFVLFGLGPALFKGGGVWEGLFLTLKLPFVWALFLGVAVLLLGVRLPEVVARPVAMLAGATIPLMLIGLGMQVSRTPLRVGGFELLASAVRLIGGPAAAFFAGRALGLSGTEFAVLVLVSGMPVAVNAYMLAAEFGGEGELAARAVAVSTLFSFFTLPAVLALVA